jgi:hypothetical protein
VTRVRAAIGIVLVLAVASASGVTAAGAVGSRPASFCSTAKQLDEDFTHIDEVDPDESVTDLEVGEAAYRRLADEAPAKLKRPIRRILAFFPTLEAAAAGDIDISDRKEGRKYVDAAAKAAKAFDKVFDYLGDRCDIDVD